MVGTLRTVVRASLVGLLACATPGALRSDLGSASLADGTKVEITDHAVPTAAGQVPFWAFVTAGRVGGSNLALYVQRRSGERAEQWPREALDVLGAIVASGESTADWTLHELPAAFGREDVKGAILLPSEGFGTYGRAAPHVVLPVTTEEFALAREFGAPRVAAMLGAQYRYFPSAFWFDRDRASIVSATVAKTSLLANLRRRWLAEAGVTFGLDLEGGVPEHPAITLHLTPKAGAQLSAQLEATRGQVAFLLEPPSLREAPARLAWLPGSEAPAAIGPTNVRVTALGGNWLVLAPGAEKIELTQAEDGFALLMPEAEWNAVRIALSGGRPFTLRRTDGSAALELAWRAPPAPAPGELVVPQGVTYKRAPAAVVDAARAALAGFFSSGDPKGVFGDALVCGPFLWDVVKDDPAVSGLGIPTTMMLPNGEEVQKLDGRTLKGAEVAPFTKVLRPAPGARVSIRGLEAEELQIYWALIPFDIEDPVFIVESGDRRLLVDMADGKVIWVDDFTHVRMVDGVPKRVGRP